METKICKCGKIIERNGMPRLEWRTRKYCNNECYNKYRYRKNEDSKN